MQQALLKLHRRHSGQRAARRAAANTPTRSSYTMDTTNILFICGGAFDGLDKIIERRTDRRAWASAQI